MLIRRELVGTSSFVPSETLWSALADFALRARRAGFRPVVCNRAVVPLDGAPRDIPGGSSNATDRRQRYGEAAGAVPPGHTAALAERLLATAFDNPRSLVIDARNLTLVYNGTSAAILGACDALHLAGRRRTISLWIHPDAADWNTASARYSG